MSTTEDQLPAYSETGGHALNESVIVGPILPGEREAAPSFLPARILPDFTNRMSSGLISYEATFREDNTKVHKFEKILFLLLNNEVFTLSKLIKPMMYHRDPRYWHIKIGDSNIHPVYLVVNRADLENVRFKLHPINGQMLMMLEIRDSMIKFIMEIQDIKVSEGGSLVR